MTVTAAVDPAANGSKPAVLSHPQGLAIFDQILAKLEQAGWTRHRIDTLVHHSTEADNPRTRWTVRHRYDHGVWEFHFEPDAYWRRGERPDPKARVARLRLDRPGTTAEAVLSDLFGPNYKRFTRET